MAQIAPLARVRAAAPPRTGPARLPGPAVPGRMSSHAAFLGQAGQVLLQRASRACPMMQRFVPAAVSAPARAPAQPGLREDPRQKHFWTTNDMPELDGKVFIVTGASSGMGYYCAKSLAERGAHVIIAARNLDRCDTAARMIKVALCLVVSWPAKAVPVASLERSVESLHA